MAKNRNMPQNQRQIEEFFTDNYFMGMPMVHTTDGFLVPWDKTRIVDMLLKETTLAETMFDIPAISELTAERLSDEVERRFRLTKPKFVSGPMIREVTNNLLMEWSHEVPEFGIYRNLLTRVGVPIYDAYQIDTGNGFESKENANLQPNPETVHKKKADRLSKEQYLLTKTRMRLAMRATAENPELASVLGINTEKIQVFSWFLTGGLACLAGAMIPMWFMSTPQTGAALITSIMAGSLLGGFTNIYGAVIGGATVGLSEIMLTTWGQAWVGEYRPLVPMLFLVVVLLFEPEGLDGVWRRIKPLT